MSNPFKVGDRVRTYQHTQGIGNVIGSGEVVEIIAPDNLRIKLDYAATYTYHYKQCRKLRKKRKPMVFDFEANIGCGQYDPWILGTHEILRPLVGKKVKVRVEEIL